MKAFRFKTKVTEKGTIHIPFNLTRYDQEIEIIILTKPKTGKKKITAKEFVKKWSGMLKEVNPEQSKFDYLSEKYS